ncbi:MAG: hypothetical protein P1U89_17030 [Verrucomicrobiales bacterium]|nr:hypothetical protein [Verrucomicrobiales bacterium]
MNSLQQINPGSNAIKRRFTVIFRQAKGSISSRSLQMMPKAPISPNRQAPLNNPRNRKFHSVAVTPVANLSGEAKFGDAHAEPDHFHMPIVIRPPARHCGTAVPGAEYRG